VLFGAGIVARLDAVLLIPAVALIGYEQHGLDGVYLRRGAVFAAASLVPVLGVPGAVHATILDVVRISNYAIGLWNLPRNLAPHAREFAFFVGTPAALLAAFGLLRLVKTGEWLRLALLAGVPLLFNLVALGRIWQSRQLLPMTPFFAALAIFGWQYLAGDPSRRRLRLAVVAVSAVVLLGPLARLKVSDGPRAPYGRVWSPGLWTKWQTAIAVNMQEVHRFVDGFSEPLSSVVLTDTWDADRFLHLHLLRAGFTVGDVGDVHASCAGAGELFVKGRARVVHLRLHQPFLASWRWFAAQRLERLALPCWTALQPSQTYLLAPGARAVILLRASPSLRGRIDRDALSNAYLASGYDRLVALSLAPSDIAPLAASYSADAMLTRGSVADPVAELQRADAMMNHQVWQAGGRP
jgi:hypothetical protein